MIVVVVDIIAKINFRVPNFKVLSKNNSQERGIHASIIVINNLTIFFIIIINIKFLYHYHSHAVVTEKAYYIKYIYQSFV